MLRLSSCDINRAFEPPFNLAYFIWLIIDSIVQQYALIWTLQSKFSLCSFLVQIQHLFHFRHCVVLLPSSTEYIGDIEMDSRYEVCGKEAPTPSLSPASKPVNPLSNPFRPRTTSSEDSAGRARPAPRTRSFSWSEPKQNICGGRIDPNTHFYNPLSANNMLNGRITKTIFMYLSLPLFLAHNISTGGGGGWNLILWMESDFLQSLQSVRQLYLQLPKGLYRSWAQREMWSSVMDRGTAF